MARMTRLLATMAAILAVVSARAEPVRYTGWLVMMPTTMRDGGTEQIPTTILKPPGDGPFAAVVVLHDCSGLSPRSSGAPMRWATLLAGQGYVAIVPDSFSTRGFPEGVCTAPEEVVPQLRRVAPIQRAYDAYAALAYLRSFPFVDGEHVGVIGGSHGGSSTLAAMVTPASNRAPLVEERRHGFAAGVALYPGCDNQYGTWSATREFGDHGAVTAYNGVYQPIAPLLILVGERDDWTPAKPCEELSERADAAGYSVAIKVYPGARHSFDSSAPTRYLPNRRNANSETGRGATTGGDPVAWADAIKEVTAFFAKELKE
ncbi:MAG TPA: dienelactone hydrolase family protein [Stellaceae bacterium]|jgi:dienelactone hydrolase|nr:dienelactone hydrolase family protein [Stellaceae bacterium]